MIPKKHALGAMLLVILAAPLARAAEPMGTNVSQMKLGPVPGLPTCLVGAIVNGDATKGPFIAYAKIDSHCTVPWHWHTASEHLMIISGVLHMEMKDAKPLNLRAGGFALVPPHHEHLAGCSKPCSMYVYSDGPFDIHFVDAKGNELAPADAMKPLKETPARPPQ